MSSTPAAPLRWAIIGTGFMASRVAAGVIGSGSGVVTAIISRSQARGRAFGAEFGATAVHGSLDAIIGADIADIVYVGSPNGLHARQALACVESGHHVLVDKPIATSERDAERLCDAAATAGVRLSTTFQNRHQPAARRVRDLLRAGSIGRVQLLQVTIGFGPEILEGWRLRPTLAWAGATANLGIHAYDLLRFLVGTEVESVLSMGEPTDRRALERTMLSLLRFRDGVLAYAQASHDLGQPDVRLLIHGSAGQVEWLDWMAPYRSGSVTVRTPTGTEQFDSACPDAYGRLVAAFERSVRDGTEPDPSPFDALQSVRIALAIKASARTGRSVRVG